MHDDEGRVPVMSFSDRGRTEFKYVKVRINGKLSSLLADTAAKASILSTRTCRRVFESNYTVQPSSRRLIAYNSTDIAVLGELHANVAYGSRNEVQCFPFLIVENGDDVMGLDLFNELGFALLTPAGVKVNEISDKGPFQSAMDSVYDEYLKANPDMAKLVEIARSTD